jgi:hypothetical protein
VYEGESVKGSVVSGRILRFGGVDGGMLCMDCRF